MTTDLRDAVILLAEAVEKLAARVGDDERGLALDARRLADEARYIAQTVGMGA